MMQRLSPLAVAISSSLIVTSSAWAQGGADGAHGDVVPSSAVSLGTPGTTGALANGSQGIDFTSTSLIELTHDFTARGDGLNGQDGTPSEGGGGIGGVGGGSVFGGLSQGGAAGSSTTDSANGGNGGAIAGKTISSTNETIITLRGTAAGHGGAGALSSTGISSGSGGSGGAGGGSVFGGLSQGGAGGYTQNAPADAKGGSGGSVSSININLSNLTLYGAAAGAGGNGSSANSYNSAYSAGGAGGAGGGSVFGGLSQGGAGGFGGFSGITTGTISGGAGGAVSDITIRLTNVELEGAQAGSGGQMGTNNGFGPSSAGGAGGGSVFGGLSQGGAGGISNAPDSASIGGNGGTISDIRIELTNVTLKGSLAGAGGTGNKAGYGAGGAGGGSVFGGLSQGGAGGSGAATLGSTPSAVSDGGNGGAISGIRIGLTNVTLKGAQAGIGGSGTSTGFGGRGSGGTGGGSVFGGLSQGGAGGFALSFDTAITNGGNGGAVSDNTLTLNDVTLIGVNGGKGGSRTPAGFGAAGLDGIDGGSIFGGYSAGGAGGYAFSYNQNNNTPATANGGAGGDTSRNTISLGGTSSISGDIYGGYSQGGKAGDVGLEDSDSAPTYKLLGNTGQGGFAENNSITLSGTDLKITGSVWGGYSADGDGTLQNSRAFTGNTLNLNGYSGSVKGIYNVQNYNWVLPKNVANQDTLITITGPDKVDLNNTIHTVAMVSDGNRLNVLDKVTLIDQAQGSVTPSSTEIHQGNFLVYDATLGIEGDAFVLRIAGKEDNTPAAPATPEGRLNPTSEAFLQGRAAGLAFTNQATDMISNSLSSCATDVFFLGDGGSSRYNTGSNIRVRDFKMALGLRKCFELQNTSKIMIGAFVDHGQGNYDSHNSFAGFGTVRGHGDLRYTGAGVLFHMDVGGTGISQNPIPAIGSKNGLYLDAVVRAGKVKADFTSNDLVDPEGVRAHYNSKSNYASAMAGIGYAFILDEQQAIDVYSRYSWSRINSDKVSVGNDKLSFGTDNSSRLRIGTRYTIAATPQIAPYVGVAYEHEFEGKVSGKAYGMSIKRPDLSGSTGAVELGVSTTPIGSVSALKLDVGVEGFFGERKGATGKINLAYEF